MFWNSLLLDAHPGLTGADQATGHAAAQRQLVAADIHPADIDAIVRRTPDRAFVLTAALRHHVDDDLTAQVRALIFAGAVERAADGAANGPTAARKRDIGIAAVIHFGLPHPMRRIRSRGPRHAHKRQNGAKKRLFHNLDLPWSPLRAIISCATHGGKDDVAALRARLVCDKSRTTLPFGREIPMILYPAIDLKDGNAVRLLRGEMSEATVFNTDPAAQAKAFEEAGCEWLHLVDLNGAFAGEPVNGAAVEAILAATNVPTQLGGGIRDMSTIEMWLKKGIARVILGTVAVENPDLVREAARAFPGQVAVGIDARKGRVATKGWAEETDVMVTDLAQAFEDAGVAAIIYTDIDRDGAMGGPNVSATADLARATSIPVIASGGVSSLADLQALKATGVISGAISGRALYDGALDLAEALGALA